MQKQMMSIVTIILGIFMFGMTFGFIRYVMDLLLEGTENFYPLIVDIFSLSLSAMVALIIVALAIREMKPSTGVEY